MRSNTRLSMTTCVAITLSVVTVAALQAPPATARHYYGYRHHYGYYGLYGYRHYYGYYGLRGYYGPYTPSLPVPRYGRNRDFQDGSRG